MDLVDARTHWGPSKLNTHLDPNEYLVMRDPNEYLDLRDPIEYEHLQGPHSSIDVISAYENAAAARAENQNSGHYEALSELHADV